MKTMISGAAIVTASLASFGAAADVVTFDDSLAVIIASTQPGVSFSVANGNLPDGDRATIDQDTGDYAAPDCLFNCSGSADGLLTFTDLDLSNVASVNSATLEFYTKSSTNGPVEFYQLNDVFGTDTDWDDFAGDGITPGVEVPTTPAASIPDIVDESPLSVDVTSIVQNWVNGAPANGFGLLNTSGDGWDIQLVTDGAEFSPRLTVDFQPVPVPAAAFLFAPAIAGLGFFRRRA